MNDYELKGLLRGEELVRNLVDQVVVEVDNGSDALTTLMSWGLRMEEKYGDIQPVLLIGAVQAYFNNLCGRLDWLVKHHDKRIKDLQEELDRRANGQFQFGEVEEVRYGVDKEVEGILRQLEDKVSELGRMMASLESQIAEYERIREEDKAEWYKRHEDMEKLRDHMMVDRNNPVYENKLEDVVAYGEAIKQCNEISGKLNVISSALDELVNRQELVSESMQRVIELEDEVREISRGENQQTGLDELNERVNAVLDMVKENIGALSLSARFKSDEHRSLKGENHNRFKQSISNDELVRDYRAAGCKITKEMLEKYNKVTSVTYNGLRNRLMTIGEWQN